MNVFICPISKTGERKVGLKVIGAKAKFFEKFKTFEFQDDLYPFGYFFHFCGELRNCLTGAEYDSIELTDGYDIQECNYYIDYTKDPVKLLCEDKDGFPIEDKEASGRKKLTYKKTTGEIKTYIVEKVIERSQYELKVVIEGGGFRNFKVDKILLEEDI